MTTQKTICIFIFLFATLPLLAQKEKSAQSNNHKQDKKRQAEISRFLKKTAAPVKLVYVSHKKEKKEGEWDGSRITIPMFMQKGRIISLSRECCVEVNDFYMNSTEVSVSQYLNFCNSYVSHDSIKPHYPDTLIIQKAHPSTYNEVLSQIYFWHPKYQNYPIVGVTYHNALAYCKWLEDSLRKESIRILGKDIIASVSLPSQAEWLSARGDIPVDHFIKDYLKNGFKGLNTGSIVTEYNMLLAESNKDGYAITNPVNEVEKNNFGLYNMMGNVAEFVSDTFYIKHLAGKIYKKNIDIPIDTSIEYNVKLLDSLLLVEDSIDRYAVFNNIHLFQGKTVTYVDYNTGVYLKQRTTL